MTKQERRMRSSRSYAFGFVIPSSSVIRISLFQPHILVRVMIKDRRIPAFHAWASQKSVCVKIDRQDRRVLEQNSFRFLKCGITRRLITGLAGLVNKPIILGVRPAGLIVGPIRYPKIEERVWIDIVTDPGGTDNLVVHLTARIEINFLLLIHERGGDVQVLAPHLLDGLCDQFVVFRRVEQNLDRWQATATPISSLRERSARKIDIVRNR